MAAGHVIPEAIQALLEKRGTFQGWLSRLDQLGSDFRPEVTEKVRSDYESRLTAVEGELEGHRTELESALAERAEAVEQIASRHDSRAAELEETQLRHAVGEFDDAEWEKRRGEQQALIDELEADLTAERSAVESLQTVLGELTGRAGVAATAAAVETVEEAEPPIPEELVAAEDEWPEPEPEVEVEEPEPEEANELDAWMTQPLDNVAEDVATAELVEADVVELELADAEVVDEAVAAEVESVEEAVKAEDAEPDSAEAAADEGDPSEFMDELEFLESLSLDDAENFDAVSAMLDEEDGDSGADEGSKKKTEDS